MHRTTVWIGALLLAACAKPNEYVAPPPPVVTVARPEVRDVVQHVEFSGTTAPHKVVEIRARVKGFLSEITYDAGALVEKGAALFKIDPAEYEAAVLAAEADVESAKADLAAAETAIRAAEARLALAETAVAKLEKAYESRAVSEIMVLEVRAKRDVASAELDNAKAHRDVAEARVGVTESRLVRARLDLSYTTIRAPMAGRVATWLVFPGDLVGAGEPTLLTTMVNDDRIWCYFDITERWLLQTQAAVREKADRQAKAGDVPVGLALTNEEGFPHTGVADYADPVVDPETGTLRVRAVFDNADGVIPGGAYARIRIPIRELKGALLVTERAVSSDQGGDFVLVVGAGDKVERRDVKLGPKEGQKIVVLEGLEAEDGVIVSGLQRARPGAVVRPEAQEKS
jgi:RND family efflux transporter MFP subunit